MRRSSRPVLSLVILVLAVFLSGCAHVGYRLARQYEAAGKYENAVAALRAALANDPGREGARERLLRYSAAAAEHRVRLAKQCFTVQGDKLTFGEKGDLFWAEYHLTRALEYEPGHGSAMKYLGQVDVFKGKVREDIAAVRTVLNEGDPDDALARVRRIQALAKTYPEIATLLRRTLRASADKHLDRAITAFDSDQYQTALSEAEIACERLPKDAVCLAWKERAERYQAADRLTRQAQQLFSQGKYEQSYRLYGQALTKVSDFRAALDGQPRALAEWTREVYESARAKEARARKPALLDALDLYLQCQQQIESFRDVDQRISSVKARLGEIYFDEAMHFAESPDLRRIGTARYCLTRARHFAPSMPDLKTQTDRVERLFALKIGVVARVGLTGRTPFAEALTKDLASRLSKAKLKAFTIAPGSADHLDAQLKAQAAAVGYTRFSPESPSPLPAILIAGEVISDRSDKTGLDHPHPIVSDYTHRTEYVDNVSARELVVRIDHAARAQVVIQHELSAAVRDSEKVVASHRKAKTQHDRAAADLSRKRQEQQALLAKARTHEQNHRNRTDEARRKRTQASIARSSADTARLRAQDYRRQANMATTPQDRSRLNRLADEQERDEEKHEASAKRLKSEAAAAQKTAEDEQSRQRDLQRQAQLMQPEIDALARDEARTAKRLRSAESWLKATQSMNDQLGKRLSKHRNELPHQRRQLKRTSAKSGVSVAEGYTFTDRPIQVFGKVHVRARAVALAGDQVLHRIDVPVEDREQATVTEGVRRGDTQGFKNRRDRLPSAEAFLKHLRANATERTFRELHAFFDRHHERYLRRAEDARKQGQALDAMEWYLCFAASSPERGKAVARAEAYVAEKARAHLK